MVIRSDARSPAAARAMRLWVRAESGEFQLLEPRSAVLIARGEHAAERDLVVRYRLQTTDAAPAASVLSVRYEIVIDPTL
jgi:hypothetical protein